MTHKENPYNSIKENIYTCYFCEKEVPGKAIGIIPVNKTTLYYLCQKCGKKYMDLRKNIEDEELKEAE